MTQDIECSFSFSSKSKYFFIYFESDRIPFLDYENIPEFFENLDILRMIYGEIFVDEFSFFELSFHLIERSEQEIEITIRFIECKSLYHEYTSLRSLSTSNHSTNIVDQCKKCFCMIFLWSIINKMFRWSYVHFRYILLRRYFWKN